MPIMDEEEGEEEEQRKWTSNNLFVFVLFILSYTLCCPKYNRHCQAGYIRYLASLKMIHTGPWRHLSESIVKFVFELACPFLRCWNFNAQEVKSHVTHCCAFYCTLEKSYIIAVFRRKTQRRKKLSSELQHVADPSLCLQPVQENYGTSV